MAPVDVSEEMVPGLRHGYLPQGAKLELDVGLMGLASFFLNIYAVLRNLASYNRVRALAAPGSSAGAPSMQPGRTLVARPGLWVFAIVLVAILVFIVTRAAH